MSDIRELVVISGKGGTGKTSLTASFAALAGKAVIADCDVDAADLHLVLNPEIKSRENFTGGQKAFISDAACTDCSVCISICRFEAILRNGRFEKPRVDSLACEGCGVCAYFCPVKAIRMLDAVNGQLFVSETRFGRMVHAKLGVAEENSGKLVTEVRRRANKVAAEDGCDLVIIDGSPGTGCPVIASLTGASLALVVTEPTLSGLHDLERVCRVTGHFGVRTLVCINKCDINEQISAEIEKKAGELGSAVVGRINYDPAFSEAQVMKSSVVECCEGPIVEQVKSIWNGIISSLNKNN